MDRNEIKPARPEARRKLDAIRELLRLSPVARPCLTCGAELDGDGGTCRVCEGRQVRAENACRAIVEVASTKGWGRDR